MARTPREIVVAADSKSITVQGAANAESVCKIRKFGDAYAVVNGMTLDSLSDYDVYLILQLVGKQNGSLQHKIDLFEALVKEPLEKTLYRMKRDEPAVFNNLLKGSPLGVNFFGVENGVLVLDNRRFIIDSFSDNGVSVDIQRKNCPGDGCINGVTATFIGPAAFKEKFEKENHDYMSGDLVHAGTAFIQTQIDGSVADVGPPIDILRITANGADWVQKKPECEY